MTVVIGEAGVNHTFIFRGKDTKEIRDGYFEYDGAEKRILDGGKGLEEAIRAAVDAVRRSSMETIREMVVGVPGDFIRLITQNHLISFQTNRRVTAGDITALYNSVHRPQEKVQGGTVIYRSNMFFVTSDKRKVIDPVGMESDSLEGLLCYFVCDDRFIETVDRILHEIGIMKVKYLPTSFAESMYLVPSRLRNGYAALLDRDSHS
ncbi:MAG: hypothetical protein ACI4U2_01440, partial [Christensenellaceae bacterium]